MKKKSDFSNFEISLFSLLASTENTELSYLCTRVTATNLTT